MISIEELWKRDKGICWLCKEFIPWESGTASRDHLIPRYAGGTHESFNLSLAHAECNSGRDHRDYEEKWPRYLKELERIEELKSQIAPIYRIIHDPWKKEQLRIWYSQKRKERHRKMQEVFIRRVNPNFRYKSESLKEALRWAESFKGSRLTYKEIRQVRKEFFNELSHEEKLKKARGET